MLVLVSSVITTGLVLVPRVAGVSRERARMAVVVGAELAKLVVEKSGFTQCVDAVEKEQGG